MGYLRIAVWVSEYESMEWNPTQDADKDSKLSLEDYRTTVLREKLLIEAFGPCLPRRERVEEFCDSIFNPNSSATMT